MSESSSSSSDLDPPSFKQVVSDCCSESTAHGIPHIFRRQNIALKLFWLACTLTSAVVCAWLVAKTITDYNSYETVTKSQMIFETPTLFPTVSICSQNMFTTDWGYYYVSEYNWENNLESNSEWLSRSMFMENDLIKYSLGVHFLDSAFTDDDRKSMGIQIGDMILLCYFNNFGCSSYDFYWYWDPYYGNCFSFNRGLNSDGEPIKDRIITKAGALYGFQLELFVGNPTDPDSYAFVNGLRVLVHNKTDKPSYLFGVNANVGEFTTITVSRTFSSRLEQPYSDCIEDIQGYADKSLYVKTILSANYTYRQANCFDVCLQKYVAADCKCYSADSPYWNTETLKPCQTLSETGCLSNTLSYFYAGNLAELCGDGCPLECDSVVYSTSASSVVYPSDMFATMLANNPRIQEKFGGRTDLTTEELRSSMLALNVYYTSLSYQSYTESPKTSVVDLVSSIGGTLGLFLGVSFLSFVEIIDLMFCVFIAFKARTDGTRLIVIDPRTQVIASNPRMDGFRQPTTTIQASNTNPIQQPPSQASNASGSSLYVEQNIGRALAAYFSNSNTLTPVNI